MPDTAAITKARESGDALDWAIAWQETVAANPEILTKDDLVGWMTGWFANVGQSMVNRFQDQHTHPEHLGRWIESMDGANPFDQAENAAQVVFQAIGAGSVCWESMEGTGVFDDLRASFLGAQAVQRLEALGVITTGHAPEPATEVGPVDE